MSPKVKRRFHNIIRRSGIQPERALEVGGLMGEDSLLRFPELAGAERYCLNLVDGAEDELHQLVAVDLDGGVHGGHGTTV